MAGMSGKKEGHEFETSKSLLKKDVILLCISCKDMLHLTNKHIFFFTTFHIFIYILK